MEEISKKCVIDESKTSKKEWWSEKEAKKDIIHEFFMTNKYMY